MEAFSDGVFAIAITLLVLEIWLPPNANADLLAASLGRVAVLPRLRGQLRDDRWYLDGPQRDHRAPRAGRSELLRLNLLLLMVVSFLPFPTRLVADHIEYRGAERVAATITASGCWSPPRCSSLLWRYALHAKLISDTSKDEEIRRS